MSSQYQSTAMICVEEAQEIILSHAKVLECEQVSMLEATGRVLAKDIKSDIDISPFDNSGMDGFAVKAANTAGASLEQPAELKIVGGIGAGEVYTNTLEDGEALRIMTGAPVPAGADTVVKIEATTVEGESEETPYGKTVLIAEELTLGKNVRYKGEEVSAGEVLLTKGTVVHPAGVGLLAATGNPMVEVFSRPRVAILSSGDELVEPSEKPGPGKIRNSNCYSLAAAVEEAGGKAHIVGIVRDNADEIREAIAKAAAEHDFVLISGGAAEGDYDYTNKIIRELGHVLFTKVNMRPGKAQTLGIINDTIVFGLAGNPSAAMVGFEILLRPALRKMQGYEHINRPVMQARLTADVKKPDTRNFYLRASVSFDAENNEHVVTPGGNQSSALLGALQNANCLVVLSKDLAGNAKGEMVTCHRLDVSEGTVV